MARSLADKPNVDAPDYDYPYGRIRDRAGSTPGTPVNEVVYGDFHQFFAKLMDEGGVVANGLPDNEDDGFQLYEAFQKAITQWLKDSFATDNTVTSVASDVNLSSVSLKKCRVQKHGALGRVSISLTATSDGGSPGGSFNLTLPSGFSGTNDSTKPTGTLIIENLTDGGTKAYAFGFDSDKVEATVTSTLISVSIAEGTIPGAGKSIAITCDFQYPLL